MKYLLILLIIFLCSACQNKKVTSCYLEKEKGNLELKIESVNDAITKIEVTSYFTIPSYVLTNEQFKKDLDAQLNENYHYEGNILIKQYVLQLNEDYSLDLTKQYLKKEKYYCE